ncbi:alpha/beta fold hydrolase [Kitasatospora sp. NPDC098663]|uniref:alpha/beta fold hydrolase n=1 Tax=Kitasatospora sp. NPDC098663 TaxID=3364096 RepID=UPI00380D99DF
MGLPGSGGPDRAPARVYLHGLGAAAAPYFAASTVHPLLAGPRALLLDLLGFGLSDRPVDFGYTLEDHADAVAVALRATGVRAADVVAHSMGGSVAIVLANRHPELVSRLVLVDTNLDPLEPSRARPGSSGIATYTESDSSPTGGRRRGTWSALTGGRPCGWPDGRRCTGARSIWPRAPCPPCANSSSPCRSRAPISTRRRTARRVGPTSCRRQASVWSPCRTAGTTSCWTSPTTSPG